MPQKCTICSHPRRTEIERAAVRGELSNRRIAAQYKITESALRRHRFEHLPDLLIKGKEAQDEERAVDVYAELAEAVRLVNKVLAACDAWLIDPEDPGRYALDHRAEEVTIIYTEPGPGGKPQRKKAPLASLLPQLAANGQRVEGWEAKRADPRELILKAAGRLKDLIEPLAEMEGRISRQPQINVLVSPQWIGARAMMLEALAPFPAARTAVAEALLEMEDHARRTVGAGR